MQKRINIDLEVKSKKWLALKNSENFVSKTCEKLILASEIGKFLQKKSNQLELSISLVSDAQIKKINQQFRGKNKATNVLSFSFLDENLLRAQGFAKATKSSSHLFLGDIVLAFETIEKEAKKAEKKIEHHLSHLLLHGLLHLIGHDHENEKDAMIMEKIEIKILKNLKIPNPYLI